MGFIKNIGGILAGGMALIFLKMAFRHLSTHDVSKPVDRILIDLIFATVFGYCAYALFVSAKAHANRLMQNQEQASRENWPPSV